MPYWLQSITVRHAHRLDWLFSIPVRHAPMPYSWRCSLPIRHDWLCLVPVRSSNCVWEGGWWPINWRVGGLYDQTKAIKSSRQLAESDIVESSVPRYVPAIAETRRERMVVPRTTTEKLEAVNAQIWRGEKIGEHLDPLDIIPFDRLKCWLRF
jgi:hypothetical protein